MNFNMTDIKLEIRLTDIHMILDKITPDVYHVIYMHVNLSRVFILSFILGALIAHVTAIWLRHSQLF